MFVPLIVMFAEPSKETPVAETSPDRAIVLAVSKAVAVAALPDVSWLPAVLTPGRLMFAVPLNDTPPIVRAVSSADAVPALPVVSCEIVFAVVVSTTTFLHPAIA
jgi:hypothetical protein